MENIHKEERMARFFILTALFATVYFHGCEGVTFTVTNQCPYVIWAAASQGGGSELQTGMSWVFEVKEGTPVGNIWGRTGCKFDAKGRGSCQTGDCGGVLRCESYIGNGTTTLAEYALNQFGSKRDFYDISLVDGFNVPMGLVPSMGGCHKVSCNKDINSVWPPQLQAPGGCKSPCHAFGTPQYCCTGPFAGNCPPTNYSRLFRAQCPQAFSYTNDDAASTLTCPTGGDYKVFFCA